MNTDQRLRVTSIDRLIEYAVTHWDMSQPANRRAVRAFRRHRFWVRWGGPVRWLVVVLAGSSAGAVLVSSVFVFVRWGL